MVCRDYSKELGLYAGPQKLPKPVTIGALVAIGAGAVAFVVAIVTSSHPHEVASAKPAPTAQVVAGGQ